MDADSVARVDAALDRLLDIEGRLAAVRARAARIVDDTGWRSQAAAAYCACATAWEQEVQALTIEVGRARAALVQTRSGLLSHPVWACG